MQRCSSRAGRLAWSELPGGPPPAAGLPLLQVRTVSAALSICTATLLALPALCPTPLLQVTAWLLAAGDAGDRAFLIPGSCLLYSGGVCGDPELWMKQSVQTTSKKSTGQKGLLKTRITCNTSLEIGGTDWGRCLLCGLVAEDLESLQQCQAQP